MKRLFFAMILATSSLTMAASPDQKLSDLIKLGIYTNGTYECTMEVSIAGLPTYGSNRLNVEIPETKVSQYGANISQSIENSISSIKNSGVVNLDNGAGVGEYDELRGTIVLSNKKVTSFTASKKSRPGEVLECKNLKLVTLDTILDTLR